MPAPEWIDQAGDSTASSLATTRWRVSSGSPIKWKTRSSGLQVEIEIGLPAPVMDDGSGMVFQMLPGSSCVMPTTSWQERHTPDGSYW